MLRDFLRHTAAKVAPGIAVTCVITTDRELQDLNRKFLHKDYATDVLSFPGSGAEPGEMAISFDRASEQARTLGHGVEQELQILMLHGMLHLRGMDHESDSGEMARAELRWRRKLGLPAGLIERSTQSRKRTR
jgi:probable rRNA maturation factor